MRIEGNTIILKSNAYNFYKEKEGKKCNTVRRFDQWSEIKALDKLRSFMSKNHKTKIKIIESSGTEGYFERELTDITFYEGYYIFSWKS